MVCLVWMSGKGRRGNVGYYFQSKRAPSALLYRGLAEGQFFVFHRRGSINHAWFSPGLMSVLHMCSWELPELLCADWASIRVLIALA